MESTKTQAALRGIFLTGFLETGRPTLNLGHCFWCQPRWKDVEEGSFPFFLLVLTLTDTVIYAVAAAGIESSFFSIPI